MGLDIYLHAEKPVKNTGHSGIFIREKGRQKEITRKEWDKRNPDREPVTAVVPEETTVLFHAHITSNLAAMAHEVNIYTPLWRAEEIGICKAEQLKAPIALALRLLYDDPAKYKKLNPENGWGDYETFCEFLEEVLAACFKYPDARVETSR
jgi:hypothetical protein